MRILALLWTVYLVRLCYGGDDKVDGSLFDVEEAEHQSVPGDKTVEILPWAQLPRPSFEYYHDENHIKLVLPQEGVIVTKISESRSVWTGKTGEVLEYAKAYLNKDGKPGFVRVWKRDSSGVKCVNYTTGRVYGWSEFKGDISIKINPLKVPVERKGDFVIDLKKDEDTKKCRIFSVNFLGVPTRSYSPKPGYYATEVKDGDESLWKASEGTDERCLSCDVYTKDEERILSITKKKNDKTDDASFEFSDGEWKHITEDEFHRKFQAMVDGPSQEPEISEHEPLLAGEAEGADSTVTSNDSVNVGKVEDNESEHISEECKDPEISSVPDTEATEQESTYVGFSESGQSDLGAQSGQTNQQGSYDTQTSSQSLNIPEDQDPMTNNSEGNDIVDADSAKTTDDTVREASEGEVELEKEDDREYKEPISATEDVIQNSEPSTPSENAALEEPNSESSISSDKTPVDPSKLDENGAGSSESSTDGQSNEVSTDGFSDKAKEMMKGEQEIPDFTLKTAEDNNTTGVSDSTPSTQEDKEQSGVSDTQSNEGSVSEPQNGSTVESTNPFEPSKPDDELKGEEELPEASESTPGTMSNITNLLSSAKSSVSSSDKNEESNNTADGSNDSKNSSKRGAFMKFLLGSRN
ncbi:conserved hypothetical protein [Theileria equi strain WA]|uniref:Signal peptide containing protein n=1 Tax=Theileria equi strain WA TaxID=1537102 RepID=L1LBZ6_THEEQ|nr:conserved hypothetical protein [Theileria equi strain WA]EKX72794.1 conserved hypothetical protein [Theileria equi strain WA]|eukprot:XP_004832246.1 conserved hypothetical protein [Theileria equi strain WA]